VEPFGGAKAIFLEVKGMVSGLSAVICLPGGVLSEKLGGGVQPTSQKPCPIYDQNLRFFLPYLWPGQQFDTLFMTDTAGAVALNWTYEGLLLTFLLITMKK